MTTIRAVFCAVAAVALGACREDRRRDRRRACRARSRRPTCRSRPRSADAFSSCRSPKATASKPGDLVARLDTRDADLALPRAQAERAQADAQLRLLLAGARAEDIRQAEAQVGRRASRTSPRAQAELAAAEADVERFEPLLARNSGSRKQRDDAATRRDVARERARAARARDQARAKASPGCAPARGAKKSTPRAPASPPPTRRSRRSKRPSPTPPSSRRSPASSPRGCSSPASWSSPRAPIVVLDRSRSRLGEVYVDEPMVPRLKLGQPATLFTDAGGAGIPGTVSYISSKAEFTPRNVQTAEDRSKLVYRVKVAVDNARACSSRACRSKRRFRSAGLE